MKAYPKEKVPNQEYVRLALKRVLDMYESGQTAQAVRIFDHIQMQGAEAETRALWQSVAKKVMP